MRRLIHNKFYIREDKPFRNKYVLINFDPNQVNFVQINIVPVSGEQWYCGETSAGSGVPNWITNPLTNGMSVRSSIPNPGVPRPTLIRRTFSNFGPAPTYTFRNDKTYQYITEVSNFYSLNNDANLTIITLWQGVMTYDENKTSSTPSGKGHLFFYSKPPTQYQTSELIRYNAPQNFGQLTSANESIDRVFMYETDWELQGFAYWRSNGTMSSSALSLNPAKDSLGWCHYNDTNSYVWFDSATGSVGSKFPTGGGTLKFTDTGWRDRNALYKFIPFSKFNFSLFYQKIQGLAGDGITIYLSQTPPPSTPGAFSLPDSTFVASLTYSISGSATYSAFYGLDGNQYLIIVGNKTTSSATGSIVALFDLKIDGGYHPGNNRQYLTTNSLTWASPTTIGAIGLTAATFSAIVGEGNTVNATSSLALSQIYTKMGNGIFKAGIWENGVWNSGWRYDSGVYEFDDIDRYVNYDENKVWRFAIVGSTASVANFEIGDKVSVGNIVAIDINEERKLLKNYFTIIDKLPEDNPTSIIVEFNNNFPLRLIKKDSDLHLIKVTKNVWLSGGFLNGYFRGVWNYGLFKGYPLITEMFDSHWIDGRFDGGHYKNTRLVATFSSVFKYKINGLGLTFQQPHRLKQGYKITIDKSNKLQNPFYDGISQVTKVIDDYQVVVDKQYGFSYTQSETGTVFTDYTSGVIQNFDFKSNNISTITSAKSLSSDAVFVYNSWVDTYYPQTSAVNILKQNKSLNTLSRKSSSENNLYGYPTYDVLSSNSTFRDSFSLNESNYRLGTKWRKYNDFIGDAGKFEEYFGATGPDNTLFLNQGWTYSISGFLSGTTSLGPSGSARIQFSRSGDSGEVEIVTKGNIRKTTGKEMIVDSCELGGVLDIVSSPDLTINSRTSESIEPTRYSIVEFDLLGYGFKTIANTSSAFLNTTTTLISNSGVSTITEPVLHFDNFNWTRRSVLNVAGITYSNILVEATYLPISQNVNHLTTPDTRKVEYFFNKTNLSMTFRGNGIYSGSPNILQTSVVRYIIDNLQFYEVDMIPFFQYFDENSINKGIQVPYQGIAPFIDYSNANFSFIDNISLGLNSIETTSSNVVVSGVGIGINSPPEDNFYVQVVQFGDSAFTVVSDRRLKENIQLVGKSEKGINIYEFNFIGKSGRFRGIIAQELIGTPYENALLMEGGYWKVNYSMIDVRFSKI